MGKKKWTFLENSYRLPISIPCAKFENSFQPLVHGRESNYNKKNHRSTSVIPCRPFVAFFVGMDSSMCNSLKNQAVILMDH